MSCACAPPLHTAWPRLLAASRRSAHHPHAGGHGRQPVHHAGQRGARLHAALGGRHGGHARRRPRVLGEWGDRDAALALSDSPLAVLHFCCTAPVLCFLRCAPCVSSAPVERPLTVPPLLRRRRRTTTASAGTTPPPTRCPSSPTRGAPWETWVSACAQRDPWHGTSARAHAVVTPVRCCCAGLQWQKRS